MWGWSEKLVKAMDDLRGLIRRGSVGAGRSGTTLGEQLDVSGPFGATIANSTPSSISGSGAVDPTRLGAGSNAADAACYLPMADECFRRFCPTRRWACIELKGLGTCSCC